MYFLYRLTEQLHNMLKTTALIICLFYAMSLYGATLIESIDDDGKTGKVTIDNDRARIDSGALGGYILVNLNEATIYAVDHKERAILDLRSPLLPSSQENSHESKPHSRPPVTFKKIGKGPVISGYQTVRYRVSIDGMHCFDEYLSEQLLNAPGVRRFTEVLGEATGADTESGMGIPFDPDAPCESADDLADDYYAKYGIPMKTVASNGLTTHKITRVITDFSPPVGTFTAPPAYRRMTRAELTERAVARIPEHSQGSTNLDSEEISRLQQQIKQQIEAMKKRRHPAPMPDEKDGQGNPDSTTDTAEPDTVTPQ